ncbi:MAG TPA: hypothetical protein VJV05_08955 [Pyrinomonadaceae bacterium]|nr:hypothetical protein [Pyrinomonadaceae bacterium]
MPRSRNFIRICVLIAIVAFVLGSVSVPIFTLLNNSVEVEPTKIPGRHPGEYFEIETAEDTFPWDRQQSEAKEFYREFQIAVANDLRKEVAAMMMYPLRVNYFDDRRDLGYRFLNSPAELLDVYDRVFHPTVITFIAKVDPDEIKGNDYFLQAGYGQLGIYCSTHGDCPSCTFDFKVKIIASNSIYRDATEDAFGNP